MTGISSARVIWKALKDAAGELPHRRMYVYQGREISFQEMDDRSDRVAAGLLKVGFRKGDRIGIIGLNQPEWLYTYFGAAKIGAVIVGLNVRYRDTELEYILNQSQAKGLVTLARAGDMDYLEYFGSFRERVPSVEEFIFIGGEGFAGSHRLESFLDAEVDGRTLDEAKAAVKPEDLIMIIYTSGTTGRPKGAALSHRQPACLGPGPDRALWGHTGRHPPHRPSAEPCLRDYLYGSFRPPGEGHGHPDPGSRFRRDRRTDARPPAHRLWWSPHPVYAPVS